MLLSGGETDTNAWHFFVSKAYNILPKKRMKTMSWNARDPIIFLRLVDDGYYLLSDQVVDHEPLHCKHQHEQMVRWRWRVVKVKVKAGRRRRGVGRGWEIQMECDGRGAARAPFEISQIPTGTH